MQQNPLNQHKGTTVCTRDVSDTRFCWLTFYVKWSTLVLGGVGERPLFVSLRLARRGGVMHVSPSFVWCGHTGSEHSVANGILVWDSEVRGLGERPVVFPVNVDLHICKLLFRLGEAA